MSEVLVGEIVFKLKADSDNMLRNLRKARAEIKAMQADSERLAASQRKMSDEIQTSASESSRMAAAVDKSSASLRRNTDATDNARRSLTRMRGLLTGYLKIAAVTTAVSLLVSAIGALGVAAYSVLSAVGSLSGLLVAFPTALIAAASAMGIVKSAMKPVAEGMKALASGDITKINAAFAAMTPVAQRFTRTLFSMKQALGLSSVAQHGLFPGLTEGLKAAIPLLGTVRQYVFRIADAIGSVGRDLGKMIGGQDLTSQAVGYNRFQRDIKAMGAANSIIVKNLGGAFIGLMDALRSVLRVGAPLTIWLTNGARKMGEWAAKTASANRANGTMAGFFQRAAFAGDRLRGTLANLGSAMSNVAKAGGTLSGLQMLDGLEKASKTFKDFTASGKGQNAIGKFFRDAKPTIDEFKKLLGDVFKLFGRATTGGSLPKLIAQIRTEFLPAVATMSSLISDRLAPALIRMASAFAKFLGAISAGPIVTMVDALSRLAGWLADLIGFVPGLGTVIASFLLFNAALKAMTLLAGGSALANMGRTFGVLFGAGVAERIKGVAKAMQAVAAAGAARVTSGALGSAATGVSTGARVVGGAAGGVAGATGARVVTRNASQRVVGGAAGRGAAGAAATGLLFTPLGGAVVVAAAAYGVYALHKRAVNKENAESKNLAVKRLNNLRESFPTRAKYVDAVNSDIDTVKKAMARHKVAREAAMKLPEADGQRIGALQAAKAEFKSSLPEGLQGAADGVGWNTSGKMAQTIVNDLTKESNDVGKEAIQAASMQKDAYKLLTGATMDLAFANGATDQQMADLVSTMGAAARQTHELETAYLNTVETMNSVTPEKGKDGFTSFLREAKKKQKEVADFTKNTQKAIARGLDPDLALEVFATGAEEGGRLMAELAEGGTQAIKRYEQEVIAINKRITAEAAAVRATLEGLVAYQPMIKIGVDISQVLVEYSRLLSLGMTIGGAVHFGVADRANGKTPAAAAINVPGRGRVSEANGGLLKFFARGGVEQHVAQIAASSSTHRVWAEPETGGEAYIPMALNKRKRSSDILNTVASDFGYMLVNARPNRYSDGGGWQYDASSTSTPSSSASSSTPVNITVNAQTDADPFEIAREAAWQFRAVN